MIPKASTARKAAWPMSLGLLVFLLAVVLTRAAAAADLRAYFDRKSVYEGDTVTLVIETNSGTLGEPDLSPLDTDFDVLGTSQSTNISIFNGQRTDTIRLLVTLAPRHSGTIEVSPLMVGNAQTGPLRLQVGKVPDGGTAGAGYDVFLELEVGDGSRELMVQQQVPVRVRLFSALPLLSGDLEDPQVEGALVTKLGQDQEYSTHRNGREYQVIERSYSLSPEHSGELHIPPVRFEGSARNSKGRASGSRGSLFDDPFFDRFFQNSPLSQDPFGAFDRGKPVSAHSRGIDLHVKARPGGYDGAHWLPAQALQVEDSWAGGVPELRVGEPVKRTLTLQAKGLSGSQIPQIQLPSIPGLRVYPDKPESETRSDGNTLYGISRQGIILIPTKPGELVIPEIRVTWWDTDAKHERVTTLPSRTLKVADAAVAADGTSPEEQSKVQPEPRTASETRARKADQPTEGATASSGNDSLSAESDGRYWLAGAIVLVILVGIGGWLLFRHRRSPTSPEPGGQTEATSQDAARVRASSARKALRTACETNDARAAAKALLTWAEASWQGEAPHNLGNLAARLAEGAGQVRELERSLYAPTSGSWDGDALWQALQGGLRHTGNAAPGKGDVLPPLYPTRRDLPAEGARSETLRDRADEDR